MRFAVLTSDVASCIFSSPGGWKSIRRSRKRTKSQIERVFNAVGGSENLRCLCADFHSRLYCACIFMGVTI